jgi:hypothetical protein
MNNNQFLKLLNESNNTFNNLTGIQNLNESEKNLEKKIFSEMLNHLKNNKFNLKEYGTPLTLLSTELTFLLESKFNNLNDEYGFVLLNNFIDSNKLFITKFILSICNEKDIPKKILNEILDLTLDIEV